MARKSVTRNIGLAYEDSANRPAKTLQSFFYNELIKKLNNEEIAMEFHVISSTSNFP